MVALRTFPVDIAGFEPALGTLKAVLLFGQPVKKPLGGSQRLFFFPGLNQAFHQPEYEQGGMGMLAHTGTQHGLHLGEAPPF
jgi:hypothetical protein